MAPHESPHPGQGLVAVNLSIGIGKLHLSDESLRRFILSDRVRRLARHQQHKYKFGNREILIGLSCKIYLAVKQLGRCEA